MSGNQTNQVNKHSPSPWSKGVADLGLHPCSLVNDANGCGVCALFATNHTKEDQSLIIAAPDLLAACESVLVMINHRFGEYNLVINDSRSLLQAAIAKAKGG